MMRHVTLYVKASRDWCWRQGPSRRGRVRPEHRRRTRSSSCAANCKCCQTSGRLQTHEHITHIR